MAVCRGGIAFWVGCGRSHGYRQPIKRLCWSLCQALHLQFDGLSPPIRNISSALSHSSCPKRGRAGQPAPKPYPPQGHGVPVAARALGPEEEEEEWSEVLGLCVLPAPRDCEDQCTVEQVPLLGQSRFSELLAPGSWRSEALFFPFTTVDGRREDDINVGGGRAETVGEEGEGTRQRESFHSLFGAESCPAPFIWGSRFYCFHGPHREPFSRCEEKSRPGTDTEEQALSFPRPPAPHCSYFEKQGRDGTDSEREGEWEDKLNLMYEKLRIELPNFFVKEHDYGLYSMDVEFINGLLNTKTRGRTVYRLTVTLWQLLCRLWLVDARLEVLKLTKHSEDGTVRARWRLRGQPALLLPLRLLRRDRAPLYRSYDAFSTFYLGPDGLIHCHRVDKVMQVQPPVLPRVTSLLAGTLVALGLKEPRPALNLLPSLLSSLRLGRH